MATTEEPPRVYDGVGWGLAIRSALPVPGVLCGVPMAAHADVRIERGHVVVPDASACVGPYARAGDALVFLPGPARYRIASDGIVVDCADPAHPDVAGLLIATALPALVWMRGTPVLHAACAAPPGGDAVAVVGASGAGKSRVLDQLYAAGWDVVADDSVALSDNGDAILASGLPGGLHLRDAGADDARRWCPIPPSRQRRSARLAAIIEIAPDADRTTRLSGVDALATLLRHRHRPRVPELLSLQASVMPTLAAAARACPVWRWSPEPDFAASVDAVIVAIGARA
ncbi:hypothetical protein M9980_11475 [Sphingomonas donggukensis]|uniref:HPr kinase/phosphorylase C-terminal domain-containing protein n=1 Tax=Sphingomonas donggukensis TaxID=2949093 RepID=A0ABY4TRZ7_9SPHN|nr:hypothetical protein [Sphingomonas donggukensis]URW75161.1 hypothetical protein M9980_11475 [Sphingomonas donggukensis]